MINISILNKFNKINDSEKKCINMILFIYMASVMIRFIIAIIEKEPHIMGDELSYTAMAYNYYKTGDFYSMQNYGVVTNIPNILYQFIISFSFYFGENFYIVIKLINSILVSLIIFPGYMLLKEYMKKEKAIFYAALTILMPFNNITSFAMAENLYFPLFVVSFYFIYRLIIETNNKYSILTSISIALLYLTKPHALALVISLIATTFIIFLISIMHRENNNQKRLLISLLKVFIYTISILLVIILIIRKEISVESILGEYSNNITDLANNKGSYPIIDFIKMAVSHVTIVSILYFFPIVVCIYNTMKGIKYGIKNNTNKYILSLLSLITFLSCLAMTIKFTINIYNDEHFLRLHVRYYYMALICLYYVAVCFIDKIKLSKIQKYIILSVFIIINMVNYLVSLPIYASPWATLSDNMDIYWLAEKNKLVIIIIFILSLNALVNFLKNKNARKDFIIYYIIFSLVANIGIVKNKILVMNPYWTTIHNNRVFIEGNILNNNSKVMLIDTAHENRTNIAFWLHYNYTDIKQLPEGTTITNDMIPNGTEYVITFGKFNIDLNQEIISSENSECNIVKFK